MIGLNGGLIGVRRVPSTSLAPGVWTQDEQSVAKQAGIWPSYNADPTPGLLPVLWYDFADETTVTKSGTNLTQISDKGTRGATLTSTPTNPQYVTGINGKKCVDWGDVSHSKALYNSSTTLISIAEAYIVLDASFGGGLFPSYNGLFGSYTEGMNVTGSLNSAGLYFEGSFDNAFVNNGPQSLSSVLPGINSPSLLRIKKSNDTAVLTNTGFQIGMDRQNLSRGWYGLIGEMIFFSSVLGSSDRTLLQSWLSSKWGLTLA